MAVSRRGFLRLLVGAAALAPAAKPLLALAAPEIVPFDLRGLPYWKISGHSGTVAGLNRSSYPGRLSTPMINAKGAALTPAVVRRFAKLCEKSYAQS